MGTAKPGLVRAEISCRLMAAPVWNCLVDKQRFGDYNIHDAILWAFCVYKQPPAVSLTGGGAATGKILLRGS